MKKKRLKRTKYSNQCKSKNKKKVIRPKTGGALLTTAALTAIPMLIQGISKLIKARRK